MAGIGGQPRVTLAVVASTLDHLVTSAFIQNLDPASSFFTQHVFYFSVAGYNYFGNERLYSGIDGREFEADVFFGVVYYQRLRHMVADKFQVLYAGQYTVN